MTTVLWARHGQNEANVSRRLSHRVIDGDLTDLGRRQASELAEALAAACGATTPVLVSSPLRRARQTADVVARRLDVLLTDRLEDLRELNVGALDGRSDDEAWATYDAVLSAWRCGHRDVRFPDGESGDELCDRLRRALVRVVDAAGSGTAVVVAHGASLRAALPVLAGVPDPGVDLATGGFATLAAEHRGDTVTVSLRAWP